MGNGGFPRQLGLLFADRRFGSRSESPRFDLRSSMSQPEIESLEPSTPSAARRADSPKPAASLKAVPGGASFQQMVARVRHDLRGSIGHILGFSEMLLEE